MKAIEFDSVTKKFPDGTVAVDQLSFGIESGETLVLIGPSGCGKTTTLRLLAGLEFLSGGSIRIDGRDVAGVKPADRNVAMMFQSDALYSHMSVRDNLSFGLRIRKGFWNRSSGSGSPSVDANSSSKRFEDNVGRVAQRLGIEKLLDRKPHQLSGGERQRVALGRAMVREPAAFLLDEPLSRLDARLAGELRSEIRQVFRDLGKPVLYVTHNQREALALADRLAVMDSGKIVQVGQPQEIYRQPANLFVANFVGDIPVNVLPLARIHDVMGRNVSRHIGAPAETSTVGFRPEHLKVTKDQIDPGDGSRFQASVCNVEWLGDHSLVQLVVKDVRLTARCGASINFNPGDEVTAEVELERMMFFDSAEARIEVNSS
jgi:ABC-type sugar transport system ATPase subunit